MNEACFFLPVQFRQHLREDAVGDRIVRILADDPLDDGPGLTGPADLEQHVDLLRVGACVVRESNRFAHRCPFPAEAQNRQRGSGSQPGSPLVDLN
ncbi:MAG: hypothetical protein K0Q72_2858 [Armatimonadetes bacterium]|jgi:hypothetical protein|nr:hypothetical protein [Armatimonadota bacterium]